jgi:hypothetical protein
MEQTDRTSASRTMLLQPEDIVAMTAEEAIADLENLMRTLERETDGSAGRQRTAGEPREPAPARAASRS